jgi:hypothetical protein
MIEANVELQSELRAGERVVWSGRPVGLAAHLTPTVGHFFFGLAFCGLPVMFLGAYFGYLNINFDGGPKPGIMSFVMLIPFLYFGIAALLSPLTTFIRMNNTVYGITNTRIIIVSKLFRRSVHSWGFGSINGVSRRDRSSNNGDVIFASEWISDGEGGKSEKTYGFLGIRDARSVEAIINKAVEQAQTGAVDDKI